MNVIVKNFKLYLSVIFLTYVFSQNLISEELEETQPYMCEHDKIPEDFLKKYPTKSLNHCPNGHICDDPFERDKWGYDTTESITYLKLFFTIIREDDSTNPAITPLVLEQQVQQLNDDFLPYGMQFEYDWRYYESSFFRVFPASNYFALDAMRLTCYVSPETQYNVVVTTLTSPGNSFTTNPTLFDPQGYESGSIMSTAGAQFSDDLSRHVFSHEMGHVFGLIHTYWGYNEIKTCQGHCVENLASGPSDYAGDRCSDTPPERWWGGETFAGAGLDSCSGQTWPIYLNKNHMNISIYGEGKFYTPQQVSRMYCYMDDYWQHIITGVTMSADVRFGEAPLTVNFSAQSDKTVTDWSWNFGDGNTANTQNAQNEYLLPGVYTVENDVQTTEGPYSISKNEYIVVQKDTVSITSVSAQVGDTVFVPISLHNFIPVSSMRIPIVLTGGINSEFQGVVLDSNRIPNGILSFVHVDAFNKRYTVQIDPEVGSTILPDTGAIAYIVLTVPDGLPDSLSVSIEPYSIYTPTCDYYENIYSPTTVAGYLYRLGCCVDIRGNIDGDIGETIDISDLVYLVDFMFTGGAVPTCPEEANVDGDIGGNIDISDLVQLVDFMFSAGPPPVSCP